MLAIDEDEIEVELSQNVDHPWGWEGKVVAVRLASGTHGGFDPVGLLHRMSSCVRRLRSDRPIVSVFGPLVAAELGTGGSESSKIRCKAPNGQTGSMRRFRPFAVPRRDRDVTRSGTFVTAHRIVEFRTKQSSAPDRGLADGWLTSTRRAA